MECHSESQFWDPTHSLANHHAATCAEQKPTKTQIIFLKKSKGNPEEKK